jgi:hypothetical protein
MKIKTGKRALVKSVAGRCEGEKKERPNVPSY